ncbi:Atu4866 domain-containing protein [Muricauda oceani]|nr:Atu4866 domain-containing protein [Allomuricauda oceani]MBW8244894.1 Atu4866 domain-containing protein [Allomuricauda oceani]
MDSVKNRVILVLVLALLSSAAFVIQAQLDKGSQPIEGPKELVAQYFDRWKNHGESFFDLLDEDAVWTVTGRSPVSGVYHGKTDFLENAVQPILKQLDTPIQPELISLTSDGHFVWLHFKAAAKAINGSSYVNTYVWKMEFKNGKITKGFAFLDTYELTVLMKAKKTSKAMKNTMEETQGYLGMWVTEDGYIRHELLPNNRYDEDRGKRESAYQGRYKVTGNHIEYIDDTGFTADGDFVDEKTLHHGGYIFHKKLE